jgi:hypothetical protein
LEGDTFSRDSVRGLLKSLLEEAGDSGTERVFKVL